MSAESRRVVTAPFRPETRMVNAPIRVDYTRYESPAWQRRLSRLALQALAAKLKELGE